MANTSIYAAFERMWQHVVAAIGKKADKIHNHDDVYETKENAQLKYDELEANIGEIDSPVDSVNGKTGAVVLTAADVNAIGFTESNITGNTILNNASSNSYHLQIKNDGGEYPHHCSICQSANNNSLAGLGAYDIKNQRWIWIYGDSENSLQLGGINTNLILQNGSYGTSLPDAGIAGRIFFKKA